MEVVPVDFIALDSHVDCSLCGRPPGYANLGCPEGLLQLAGGYHVADGVKSKLPSACRLWTYFQGATRIISKRRGLR